MSFAHFDEIYDICDDETEMDRLFNKETSLTDVVITKNIRTFNAAIPTSTNLSKKEQAKELSLV